VPVVQARTTSHGGTFCQKSVVICPGDLEIAGLAVVLAFSQLPYSRRRAAGYYTGTGGNQDEAVRQFRRWAWGSAGDRRHLRRRVLGMVTKPGL
jgi:hypothetical protein